MADLKIVKSPDPKGFDPAAVEAARKRLNQTLIDYDEVNTVLIPAPRDGIELSDPEGVDALRVCVAALSARDEAGEVLRTLERLSNLMPVGIAYHPSMPPHWCASGHMTAEWGSSPTEAIAALARQLLQEDPKETP